MLACTDEQIEALLANAFGHLVQGDTDTLQVMQVGNFWVLLLTLALRLLADIFFAFVCNPDTKLEEMRNDVGESIVDYLLQLPLRLWVYLGLVFTYGMFRKSEFAADEFACKLGYGAQLYDALVYLQAIEVVQKYPSTSDFRAVNAAVPARLEALEEMGVAAPV